MSNSEKTPKLPLGETPIMYWVCGICGFILLMSFVPYSMDHGFEKWVMFISVLTPAFPGVVYALAKDAGESMSSILLLVVFAVFMISVFMIVVDLVKRIFKKVEPMPANDLIMFTRWWAVTSLGFLILAAGFFLYSLFKGGSDKDDEYIIIRKK